MEISRNLYQLIKKKSSIDKEHSVAPAGFYSMKYVQHIISATGSLHFCCHGIFSFDLQIFMHHPTIKGLELKV